ncbi:MAG: ribonuclease R [Gemmataceae bacterium]|nr:ribonuclease R [Gemmataceae bacterium]
MNELEKDILAALAQPSYYPLKPKALARKLGLSANQYIQFKGSLRALIKNGRIEIGKGNAVRTVAAHAAVTGILRKTSGGFGFVRPHVVDGKQGPEIYIPEESVGDAVTGDEVLVRIRSASGKRGLGPRGEVFRVLERATHQFVGTYFERDAQGFVRVDGTVFSHSVYVGDPGAKGAKPEDKVVFEMLRFPTPEDRGEGVITEILGPRGQPGVDTLSIIRGFGLPDGFAEDALAEARAAAANFNEKDLGGREDFTGWTTVTIDPVDAHDFDDAVSLTQDPKSKHWLLGVHIADVGHFVPPGSALDREARKRATSVYLPQRVLPMLPEIISNSLASLQEGKVRFVKSVLIDFSPVGIQTGAQFANAAIRVKRRFSYEQAHQLLEAPSPLPQGARGEVAVGLRVDPEVYEMLFRMRVLASILHKRRLRRGALELDMPEVELEYDAQGRVAGGHFRQRLVTHRIIEEFMLAANEAVAGHVDRLDIGFLRRVHPAPDPAKLKAFADFARILGYKIQRETDRYALQRVLQQSANRPEVHAVHYALLRSLKQAAYSPQKDDHYALASENYCHFTSPIRRYPDLVVHRLLDQLLRRGKAGSDFDELLALGDHCSKMERRADVAERELVKLKLLTHLNQRLGMEMEVVITGVADYGFYGQAEKLPVEGLVHISTLPDDYYYFDQASHSLIGQRSKRRYRLGDKVMAKVVRVDLQRRQLDLRVIDKEKEKKRMKK